MILYILDQCSIFSVIKYWLCEGPLAERQRRRARARRKQFIQERVVSKVCAITMRTEMVVFHNMESPFLISHCVSVVVVDQTVIRKQTDHHQDDNDTGEEGGEIFSRDDTKKTHTFDHSENEDHNADEGFIYRRQKTNLEVLSTSQHNLDEEADSSRLECQICLADFQVGDKICWSNNPACFHTFHIACLEPWLMKHDECPVCRSPYLVRPKEPPVDTLDNEEAQTIRGPMSPITRRVVAALALPFSHRDDQHEPESNRNDPISRRRDRDEGEGGSRFPLEDLAAEAWSHGRNNRDAAFEALPSSSLGSPEGSTVVTPSREAQSCFVDIDLDVESGNAER